MCKRIGRDIKKASFFYVREKKWETISINDADITEAEQFIKTNIKEIEEKLEELMMGEDPLNLFTKKPNGLCKSCPHVNVCCSTEYCNENSNTEVVEKINDVIQPVQNNPKEDSIPNKSDNSTIVKESKKAIDMDILNTLEDAREIGAEILRLEGYVKNLKDKLQAYVKQSGDEVVVDNKVFGFVPSVSWSFEPTLLRQMTIDAINKEQVNFWEFLDFGSTSRKSFAKKMGWSDDKLEEFLKNYGTAKESKSFRCTAIK